MRHIVLAAALFAASFTAQAGTRYETDYHTTCLEQVRYRCAGCGRDPYARIERNRSAVKEFKRQTS